MVAIFCCTTLLLMIKQRTLLEIFSAGRIGSWIRDFWHVANLSCFTKKSNTLIYSIKGPLGNDVMGQV